MQKTRKERILEALKNEKKKKKGKTLKTGATIAGVTAIATSITVPGIEVIVQADETATISNSDKATSSSTPATTYSIQKTALRSGATVQSFIQTIQASSTKIAADNDLYASVMIAQAILESAYGTSELGSAPNYNLFGIKGAYNGQSYTKQTLEDDGKGNYYPITAKFRKYPSYHQSLEDYAKVIRNGPSWNPNYYSKVWKSNTNSYKDATKALTGTYATDTAYATKLNNLISTYNLTQYDKAGSSAGGSNSSNSSSTTYTVVKGDSLWKIANKYKVSVANLKSWNNLKSDNIYTGQKLKVSASSSSSNSNASTPNTNNNTSNPNTSTSAKTYTVVKGDSLWKIANKYKVSVANLKSWNNLKSDNIYTGQKLKVSASSSSNSTNTSKPSTNTNNNKNSNTYKPSASTSVKTYTVVKGDSLWKIANKYKVTVANLKSWNSLKSDNIKIGQKLKVSAPSTSSNTNTSKPSSNKPNTSATKTHTVKKGDSLWSVSRQYKTTVDNIKSWNKLKGNTIYVGQKLTIK
ncbi:1,4-beta-N-acetylmuramoylhydrolase [Listeria ivanovii]|uniref:Peptidoglycan hydrolase n=1 Tax=Listeria ivanovii TaxID=1638 RepID=A0AAX2DKG0_LISIV|nr:1,4-beta-N-acetylmuramoylhydrolase [Listeria ivanovii]AIS63859.1 autolysin [Listeria ivanovii subsp. londoniensis]MBK1966972.1 1,4-beta-N-acetylmuramoylhydrolase [Listeria ivanovii subsp. londoniensis]MBK1983993.1 1,4-beta-N-acetylmuramoylhydrolase [Listeria ivanovii subsp. londoniensis]MBK1997173.1 1,4-beta-N-acetylmuramoylhydrolase [Listeria ivanovii subsp. londoniensis]MBK2003695.1 1,4-beta-N-acetylmuramoylhydrolase [Listeria ivanovii subsp. londoniensis]